MEKFMMLSVDNRKKIKVSDIFKARRRKGFYHEWGGCGPVFEIHVKTSDSAFAKWHLYIKCLWPEEYYQIWDDLKIDFDNV